MIELFYLEPFREGVLGWVMGLLAWVLTLVVVGLIGWGLFYLIDSCFLPTQTNIGEVVNKWMTPSHYITTYTQVGKVMVPMTTYIPDSWSLEISISGLTDAVNVSEYTCNTTSIGQKLECDYVIGRISSGVYIDAIH